MAAAMSGHETLSEQLDAHRLNMEIANEIKTAVAAIRAERDQARDDLKEALGALEGFQQDFCKQHCVNLDRDHFEECTEARALLEKHGQ